ncbi:MAG TPA: MarR family transcriptional regulator [Acetobacteraceae bacterium]|nr:MarR family transcriptional regulator [Acetobacteraceae bacterium]
MPSDEAATVDRESAAEPHHQLELRTWLRALTCVKLIQTQIRARLRMEFETTLPRFDVLAQLDAARGSLTMGELSARLMVTSGNVTGLVDAMEQEGLVSRRPHPTDRRSTVIRTTEAGRALFARMAPAHADWLAELMAGLDQADARMLLVLLGRLKEGLLRGG